MKFFLLLCFLALGILASPSPNPESSASESSSDTLITTTLQTITVLSHATGTIGELAAETTTDIISRPIYHANEIGSPFTPWNHSPLQWLKDQPRCMLHFNQVWSECPIPCPAKCDQPAPKSCRKKCKPGCTCMPGYKINRIGYCVDDYTCRHSGFWKARPGWYYEEDEKAGLAGPNVGAPYIYQAAPPEQMEKDKKLKNGALLHEKQKYDKNGKKVDNKKKEEIEKKKEAEKKKKAEKKKEADKEEFDKLKEIHKLEDFDNDEETKKDDKGDEADKDDEADKVEEADKDEEAGKDEEATKDDTDLEN